MLMDNNRTWQSLMQLTQVTYAVLERKVPESESLPSNELTRLRLLRCHDGKTAKSIITYVGATTTMLDETICEMDKMGFMRC